MIGPLLPPAPPSVVVVDSPPVFVTPPPVIVTPPPVVVAPDPVFVAPPPEPQPSPAGGETALQITDLDRGGAARAGLQKGDIILSVDGARTKTFTDLRAALTASKGTSLVLFFNPDTQKVDSREVAVVDGLIGASVIEVPVALEEPAPPVAGQAPPGPAQPAAQTALQITVVGRGGAARAGVLVNDVILGVDGKWVTTEAQLTEALKASKGESDVVIYNPDTAKVETRKVSVSDGSIGVTVQSVPISLKE